MIMSSVIDQSDTFLSSIAQELQTVHANDTALESLNTEKKEWTPKEGVLEHQKDSATAYIQCIFRNAWEYITMFLSWPPTISISNFIFHVILGFNIAW